MLDTSESFIAIYDPDSNALAFPINWHLGRPEPYNKVLRVDDPACLSKRVILERQPILLRTQAEVDSLSSEGPEPGDRQISSWLSVPIMQGEQVFSGDTSARATVCASCGKPVGSERFCSNCGAPTAQAKCAGCGTDLAAGARFCPNCGQAVAAT